MRGSGDRSRRQSFVRRSSGSGELRNSEEGRESRPSLGERRPSLQNVKDMPPDPDAKKKAAAASKARDERRSFTLQRFAMNDGLNDAMSDIANDLVHGIAPDATPKQKMQAVMINAKQRGMTIVQIFKMFLGKGGPDDDEDDSGLTAEEMDVELTPAQFGEALHKLGPRLFKATGSELDGLVADFDEDANGTISLIEFRSWCYQIPHLAWKAERLRFEKGEDGTQGGGAGAGGSTRSGAKSRRNVAGASPDKGGAGGAAAAAASGPIPAKLQELYKGTKLFWHTREKLEIVVSESKPYECLVVCAHNETACKVCTPVFIDLAVAIGLLDSGNFESNVQKAIEKAENDGKKKKLDTVQCAEISERIRRESLANLVLLRLKLVDGETAILPLSSDSEQVASELLLPENPGIPPAELPQFEVREEVNFGAGAKLLEDINRASSELQSMNASADRASTLLRMSMDALDRLRSSNENLANMSGAKKKFYWAFKRHIVREQVVRVQKRLESSPTYHALLKEQAEKQAASKGSASAPSFAGMAMPRAQRSL